VRLVALLERRVDRALVHIRALRGTGFFLFLDCILSPHPPPPKYWSGARQTDAIGVGHILFRRFPPRQVFGKTRGRFWYCGDQVRVVRVHHGRISRFLDVSDQEFDAGNRVSSRHSVDLVGF
jgi:hypothetical protein